MESHHDHSDATDPGPTVEQHSSTIIQLARDFNELYGKVSGLQQLVGRIDARVRAETARLDAHESRIATLEHGRCGKHP